MSAAADKVITLMGQPLPSKKRTPKGERQPGRILPFKAIRQEIVFSKLPIHNLAKTGTVQIHIQRQTKDGKLDFLWSVSPSRDHGEPRQLAYKLDTLVINRRIEQQGRPIPKLIRLGSLNQICKNLGLAHSGKNKKDIKAALRQNAGAFLTAELKYRGNDGTLHELEGHFTRYTLIFTGKQLPGSSKKADSVYIELHPRFQEVLNTAPTRPLNYDYLNQLSKSPATARFYEIISYRLYPFFKFRHPHVKMTYSEYCRDAPQRRNHQLWQVKRQMEPIHRRHIESGYLSKVWYEETTDGAGNPDWFMFYIPGPKARTEYETFTGKKLQKPEPPADTTQEDRGVGESSKPEPNLAHLKALTDRGVSADVASKTAATFTGDFDLKLAWLDERVQDGTIDNPPGFYIRAFKENWDVPEDFTARRHHRQQEHDQEEHRELQMAYYSSYVAPAIEAWIAENQTEYQQLLTATRQLPKIANSISEAITEKLASIEVKSQIESKLNLLAFDQWRQQNRAGDYRPAQPDEGSTEPTTNPSTSATA